MNIKSWIITIINALNVFVVLFLSITFYKEFSKVLDNRVLQQLNSIKTLKQVQLEKLIDSEWQMFKDSTNDIVITPDFFIPQKQYKNKGIYDVTHLNPTQETAIVFVDFKDGVRRLHLLDYTKIKHILLERTGMGLTGESYIVADDFRMRSQSRFFPDSTPYTIKAKTKGVLHGLQGAANTGKFKDYRGINVYSAYQPIQLGNLNWVILSEIDVDEVSKPLLAMRKKLIIITICIVIISVFLSLFLTKIITQPIIEMKKRLMIMAKGNYKQQSNLMPSLSTSFFKTPKEINEMFEALISLKTALSGAVDFSVEVGNMNLTAKYSPKSTDDLLGKTLLKMREKLIDFRNKEQQSVLNNKRILVDRLEGERKKLARELHDGIGPLLTTLKFYIQNNITKETHKTEIKKILDTTIAEVRAMTNSLMPSTLEDFGIGPTLKNYVQTIQQSVAVKIEFDDASKGNISNQLAINLFRIVQELINNTVKHSQAKQIKITLSEFDNFISLFYFDDGGGFDINTINLGSGITNIKERVALFNGTLNLDTNNNTTIFEIEVPI